MASYLQQDANIQNPNTNGGRGDNTAVDASNDDGTSNVTDGTAGGNYAVNEYCPPNMMHCCDRGKPRSEKELACVFVMKEDGHGSVDVPGVFQYLCGYLLGLETIARHLQQRNFQSNVFWDTDEKWIGSMVITSDYASDAEVYRLGISLSKYPETMKEVTTIGAANGWHSVYVQCLSACCKQENTIADEINQLRNYPTQDHHRLCQGKSTTEVIYWIERWKLLTAIKRILVRESENLSRTEYPCLIEYSSVERNYGSPEKLQIESDIDLPKRWRHTGEVSSEWTRQFFAEVIIQCRELNENIRDYINRMEVIRKENYATLCVRVHALNAILQKLNDLKDNITSGRQALESVCTEEEIWYNQLDYAYVDVYERNDGKKEVKESSMLIWESTEIEERRKLSINAFELCGKNHQQYGDLVNDFRTARESKHSGIKTHVSELEGRVVDIQKTNADLTDQLEIAEGKLARRASHWSDYIKTINEKHSREMERQRAQTREQIEGLKMEKDNLLTRLSKIAGTKLVHGNPAITDLSDTNRPTKLSEKYSELYDNEWTDALEELMDATNLQGEDVVYTKTLLSILEEAFRFCCDTESRYVKMSIQSLTSLPGPDLNSLEQEQVVSTVRPTLSEEQNQQLDELRKACMTMLIPAVESRFLTRMEETFENVFKGVGGEIENDQSPDDNENPSAKTKNTGTSEDQLGDARTEHAGEASTFKTNDDETEQRGYDADNGDQKVTSHDGKSTRSPEKKISFAQTCDQPPSPNMNMDDQTEDKSHSKFTLGSSDMLKTDKLPVDKRQESRGARGEVRISSLRFTSKFAKTCVNLCWYMRIQNPPMHIDTEIKEGDQINKDFYKNYTQKGERVGFLVWPALFLHKGGPLLCKGIVQPLHEK
ncbi:uncharacterized protein [Argopecten irradians]|uniref:uncharacterized protein isoform X2 n=1 Tax=Argopecten irradians TaxID=31199 RepID=UPI0037132BA8